MSKAEPLLAILRRADGSVRSVCLGCTAILHEQGMVEIVEKRDMSVMNAPPGAFCSVLYEIVPPFTLDECRYAIRARHVGEPWGS